MVLVLRVGVSIPGVSTPADPPSADPCLCRPCTYLKHVILVQPRLVRDERGRGRVGVGGPHPTPPHLHATCMF
jgi:hypothetical protein